MCGVERLAGQAVFATDFLLPRDPQPENALVYNSLPLRRADDGPGVGFGIAATTTIAPQRQDSLYGATCRRTGIVSSGGITQRRRREIGASESGGGRRVFSLATGSWGRHGGSSLRRNSRQTGRSGRRPAHVAAVVRQNAPSDHRSVPVEDGFPGGTADESL